ncbi:hypothetical protein O0L34_g10667 [Tuta absoluta]|nr:hypothetical protein O0L34_g10667 [Tuta absoluta]
MDMPDPLMLKVCRACLSTDVKLFNLHQVGLAETFGYFTRNPVELSDGFPQYVCYYCRAQLQKCTEFQDKCRDAHFYLQEIYIQQLVITSEYVQSLDKKKFHIPLSKTNNFNVNYIPKDDFESLNGEFKDDHADDPNEVLITVDNITHKNDTNYLYNDLEDNFDDRDNLRSSDDDDDKEKLKETVTYDNINYNHESKIENVDDDDTKEGIVEIDVAILKDEETLEKPKKVNTSKAKSLKVTKKKKEVKDTITKPEKKPVKKKSNKYNEKSEEDFEEFSQLYNVDVVCLSLEQQIARVKEKKESKEYKEARMSCDVCYKGFMTETAYKRHMKAHDPSTGAHPCDVCQLRYPSQRILRAHMRLHKREFVCRTCGHVNNSTTRAKQHSKWHKGFKYECKICHKQCNTQTTYMAHKREAHKPVTCEQCGQQCVGTLELSKHKTQAHAQSCNSCGTVFQTSEALERHKNDVNGCNSITISCWICGANFPFKSSLHQHIEEQHSDKGGVFTCELCGAVFSSDRSLGIHYAYNHSKRVKHHSKKGLKMTNSAKTNKDGAQSSYLCEICAKAFPCPAKLKVHLQIHTGEKPYRCPMCPKAFRTKSALEIHINVHTGDRPYKCRQCPETFKSYAQRYKHNLMVHTRERRHKCSMCDKTYVIAYDLKAHVRFAHLHQPRPPRNRRRNHISDSNIMPDNIG